MSIDLGKKFLLQKNFKDAEKVFLDLNKNNNNFVFSQRNFDFGFESHSIEILVQIDDLESKNGAVISI